MQIKYAPWHAFMLVLCAKTFHWRWTCLEQQLLHSRAVQVLSGCIPAFQRYVEASSGHLMRLA
jgi:hypothetical protein